MKINTKLTKVSRNVKKQKGFINPGIYKGSTMIFDTFEDYLNDINNHDDRNTLYGINKNPSVEQLEQAISSLYKCHDTVVAPSGLAALIIPFFAFLKKNDEVILPSYVCKNVLYSLTLNKVKPVFCDIGENWVITFENIKKCLSKKTKGIIIVHTFGHPCNIKEIKKLKFKCTEVSDFTGLEEILGGRVKTLHPKIHAGILNKRDNKTHLEELKKNDF